MFSKLNYLLSYPVVDSIILIFSMLPLNTQFHVIHYPQRYPLIKGSMKYPKANGHAIWFH